MLLNLSQLLTVMALMLCAPIGLISQGGPATSKCTLSNDIDTEHGQPLIYGDIYQVGSLHLRFEKSDSNQELIPEAVHIYYYWHWLKYPYPEHDWGAWVDADERLDCSVDKNGKVEVPMVQVRPRGWYNGKHVRFPWSRKPYFDRLEIAIERSGNAERITVAKRDLRKYETSLALVRLSSEAPTVVFSPNP